MANSDTQTPEEDRPEEESSTVGAMLRAAREERELSIEQISGELRIEPQFLIALEEDSFDGFPAPVFTKGYIKQYGQRVGLDYGDLLAEYYRQVEVRDLPMLASRPIRLRDEQQIAQWIVVGVILSVLVVGFLWYLSSDAPPVEVISPVEESVDPGMNEETVLEAPPPSLPEEPVPVPDPAPDQELNLELDQDLEPEPEPELGPDQGPEAGPEAGPEPGSETLGVEETDPDSEPAATLAGVARAVPDLPPGPTIEVTINFEQDCWTEVTDARGERFFYGLGSAGAVSSFDARLPLSFFLGNAGGVRLQLNGRPYPIPTDSRQGNLARFVIAEGL